MAKSLLFCWLLLFCSSLPAAPLRVITLAPHLTELAFAAGITPVAVSAWSGYPAEAQKIEQVATWQGMNLERILQLKPDVVLAWPGGTSSRQVAQLVHSGIHVEWVATSTLDDMIHSLAGLARWSPSPQRATQAATQLRQQVAALRQRYRPQPPVRVFVQFGLSPMYTAAKATLQNDIIGLCGGQNIFAASPVSWPQVSREQVLMRHPQVIVTTGGSQQAETLAQFWRPQLNVRIIAINEDWLSRPGPRILLAAEQLCEALHPAPKASSGH
ncbi:vitamin B12 ABC transporter substrate-binding protein BtuF [Pantoea stewartii]|uniref:vitamin B12 ABC transporter substrate-binding protein BtuF n=1 Tax=Pantoea stewartii TaxID=66269 RepID=UPI00249F4AEE|nr:vitamin B12 ABC transporter substrate-binding protein BtuF [Pantoea stewartii]